MSKEQVDEVFNEMVGRQADLGVAHRLSIMMDLAGQMGGWPDNTPPKLVRMLWK